LVWGDWGKDWVKDALQTSVDPAAQAYVVGQVQLSNLQKLAEQQSCYSGPKKNLVEDE